MIMNQPSIDVLREKMDSRYTLVVAAAKAGVIAFTKSLAKEMGRRGILVNAVAPGLIDTQMTTDLPQQLKDTILPHIALERFGQPEEVAEVVLFLARSAHYVTGSVVVVDGGLSL